MSSRRSYSQKVESKRKMLLNDKVMLSVSDELKGYDKARLGQPKNHIAREDFAKLALARAKAVIVGEIIPV